MYLVYCSFTAVSILPGVHNEYREAPPFYSLCAPTWSSDLACQGQSNTETNVSRFEKGDHFAQIVDFDLVVLCKSTVDELSVVFCCTSMVAPFLRYACSKY